VRVVIDSTEFVADFKMTGNAFRVLAAGGERLGARISVPSVVVEEVCNSHRQFMESLMADVDKIRRKNDRARAKLLRLPKLDIDREAAEYRETWLKDLKRLGAEILPYPDVPHETLVKRAMERKKPFKDSGAGYRDTLIWLSVVALAKSCADEICLVSANTRDFAEEGKLHPSLLADLTSVDVSETRVRYFPSLEEFNSNAILPTLTRLDGLIASFAHVDTVPGKHLRLWLERNLENEIEWCADTLAPIDPETARVSLSSIRNIGDIEIDDVRVLGHDQILVSVTVDVTVNLSIQISWDAYEQHEEIQEFVGPTEPFHELWTDTDADGSVELSLVMHAETFNVISSEVDAIDSGWRWATMNPHPRRAVLPSG
jgi:PIN domain